MKPAKKRTLVDIVQEYEGLLNHIEENAGEVEDALLEELNNCDAALADKVDKVLFVRDKFEAQASMYKDRGKRLVQHAKSLQNRADKLHELVRTSLIQLGVRKLSTESYPMIFLRDTKGIEIPKEGLFISTFAGDADKAFIEYTAKIRTQRIKEWLKEGHTLEELNGLVVQTKKLSLTVK